MSLIDGGPLLVPALPMLKAQLPFSSSILDTIKQSRWAVETCSQTSSSPDNSRMSSTLSATLQARQHWQSYFSCLPYDEAAVSMASYYQRRAPSDLTMRSPEATLIIESKESSQAEPESCSCHSDTEDQAGGGSVMGDYSHKSRAIRTDTVSEATESTTPKYHLDTFEYPEDSSTNQRREVDTLRDPVLKTYPDHGTGQSSPGEGGNYPKEEDSVEEDEDMDKSDGDGDSKPMTPAERMAARRKMKRFRLVDSLVHFEQIKLSRMLISPL